MFNPVTPVEMIEAREMQHSYPPPAIPERYSFQSQPTASSAPLFDATPAPVDEVKHLHAELKHIKYLLTAIAVLILILLVFKK